MFRRHSFVKILTLFLVLSIGFIVPNTVHVNAALRIYSTVKETRFVEGVRHTRIVGEIDHNGTKSKQIINYVGANLKDTDINVVVGDNYADYGFGMSNIISQAYNVNRRLKDAKVIAGVNGDFYNMSNGIPIMGFVRNFEVLFEGVTHGRTLIGFKDNGEVVFGQPIFEGYEVMVYNEEGELKLNKIKVNGFNRLPKNDSEVTVYFNEYESLIDSADQKMVIDATDIKSDGSGARYFGKGSLNTVTTDRIEVGEHSFVLMGDKLFEAGFITGGDKALRVPIENVEDSMKAAEKDLKKYKLNARDVVIGIAASGRTPYAIGGIEYANELGCETACVTTSSNSLIASVSKYPIEAITGAEPVTGSTRMKSGTAQKLILNMITTASMVKIGKVYENLMVDVQMSNDKLVSRATSIVMDITGCDRVTAEKHLDKYSSVKYAIFSIMSKIEEKDKIKHILEEHDGNIRESLKTI